MEIYLTDKIKDQNGNTIASLQTTLVGDGKTPLVQTTGESNVIGFKDDGTPIFRKNKNEDNIIENAQHKFMSNAIKIQKIITQQNGNDATNINMIH